MKAEETIADLAESTDRILQSTDQLLVITAEGQANRAAAESKGTQDNPSFHSKKIAATCQKLDKSSSTLANVMGAKQARDDLTELLEFDEKLLSCDQMTKDIERF